MWHRIHIVPRRALCNPSTWKTQHTVQKNMLLQSVGDLRVTEGFCCRTGKPLETAVDQWEPEGNESSFPLLWVGRSSFAKVRASDTLESPANPPGDGMQAARDLQDDEDGAPRGMQQTWAGGTPSMDLRRAESNDHGTPDERSHDSAGLRDEVGGQHDPCGVEDQGGRAGRAVQVHDNQELRISSGSSGTRCPRRGPSS